MASYMMAAKLRKLTSSNRPKAFTMSPETGYIEPFSTHKVTVKFHPQDAPPETGFRAKAVPPESVAQDYEYIATFDFEGHGPRWVREGLPPPAMPKSFLLPL